jgi:antitoxin component of RelBE/YafQ-DinJ toxin-antitoxin module
MMLLQAISKGALPISNRKHSGAADGNDNTAAALRDQLRNVDELWRSSNRQCPNVVSMKRQVATDQLKEKLQHASDTATITKVCNNAAYCKYRTKV